MSDMCRRNSQSCESAAGNGIQVTGDQNIREVNLRNGAKADVGIVNGVLDFLISLAENNSEHFQLLLNLARGEKPTASRNVVAELKRAGVISQDGSVTAIYRNVLLSAYQETTEGIVLASPFAPRDDAEVALIQANITASENRLVRFARKLGLDRRGGEGEGQDR